MATHAAPNGTARRAWAFWSLNQSRARPLEARRAPTQRGSAASTTTSPRCPLVFFSGLPQRHHLRAGHGLAWAIPSLVHWIAHGEYALTTELPRHLARLAAAADGSHE